MSARRLAELAEAYAMRTVVGYYPRRGESSKEYRARLEAAVARIESVMGPDSKHFVVSPDGRRVPRDSPEGKKIEKAGTGRPLNEGGGVSKHPGIEGTNQKG